MQGIAGNRCAQGATISSYPRASLQREFGFCGGQYDRHLAHDACHRCLDRGGLWGLFPMDRQPATSHFESDWDIRHPHSHNLGDHRHHKASRRKALVYSRIQARIGPVGPTSISHGSQAASSAKSSIAGCDQTASAYSPGAPSSETP